MKDIPALPEAVMAKADALDLKVQVWTVNRESEMRWLIDDLMVDGIMTDNPLLLETVLAEP